MEIKDSRIDAGTPFDWGRTSSDYARYRDIYPPEFYAVLTDRGLCVKGQRVLDLGTGTGVLPRNLYRYGAEWLGTDISPEQIEQAKRLASEAGMQIEFRACKAEQLDLPDASIDVVTACQCFWYFDYETLMPRLAAMLKPGGTLAVMQMEWLPYEDEIANASEQLVLEFNPQWTGAGWTREPVYVPEAAERYFTVTERVEMDLRVHFTRESWHGRMRACRGVGASLSGEALRAWERRHMEMLVQNTPPEFDILHHAGFVFLRKRTR